MTRVKALRFRERALVDVEAAAHWYATECGPSVADDFVDALAAAYVRIARHPRTGSPRSALELAIPDLRTRLLDRHPWAVFYVERDTHIEVLRVLHTARDIPQSLIEPDR